MELEDLPEVPYAQIGIFSTKMSFLLTSTASTDQTIDKAKLLIEKAKNDGMEHETIVQICKKALGKNEFLLSELFE